MTRLRFTIHGNQEDHIGNPIPYTRALANQFRSDAARYMAWKEYVRASFERTAVQAREYDVDVSYKPVYTTTSFPYPQLCAEEQCAAVHVRIFFQNGHHGDGDNILKGIMDALFHNDKCVWSGSFESYPARNGKGRVEVTLEIMSQKEIKTPDKAFATLYPVA